MKLAKVAMLVSILPVLAFGRSLHPDTFRSEVAPVLQTLSVQNVASEGVVLKQDHFHPTTSFLIGIPAQVDTRSACVDFVGTETRVGAITSIRAVGSSNPVMDACIAVMPMPVTTQITLKMDVVTGGFVPAARIQQRIVDISGAGRFSVTLDMSTERVSVRRIR